MGTGVTSTTVLFQAERNSMASAVPLLLFPPPLVPLILKVLLACTRRSEGFDL